MGIILLAAVWVMEVAVLCRDTKINENQWECSDWLSYAGGALIKVADSAGSTVFYGKVKFGNLGFSIEKCKNNGFFKNYCSLCPESW